MHMAAGRKRKPNVARFPSGQIREELPEHVIAVALAPRLRDGLDYEDTVVRDERSGKIIRANQDAGHTLGRLRLLGASDPGGISERQYHVGMSYAHVVRRHASIMGYALGSPKSPGFELVAAGLSLAKEPEEDEILRTRRQFSDCYRVLMDAGKYMGAGTRVATVTYDACLDRITFAGLQRDSISLGNLKVGLNELGRVLK